MRRVLGWSAVVLFLLGMTVNVAMASDKGGFINDQKPAESVVSVVRSFCFWGFYIHSPSQGWETRLFVANLLGTSQNYDAVVLRTSGLGVTSFSLPPNAITGFDCTALNACNQAGWIFVQSDANYFGATLFIINGIYGGGSFTAQSPTCEFFL